MSPANPEAIAAPQTPVHPLDCLQACSRVRAVFLGRTPGVDTEASREVVLERLAGPHAEALQRAGFDPALLRTAEQVHGAQVAVVDRRSPREPAPGADALVTGDPAVVLGIHVADCAAVYLADRQGRAVALIHSGRRGTSLGIGPAAVEVLRHSFGCEPESLVAVISPCVRGCCYDSDFAVEISAQLRAAGVSEVHDAGVCTGCRTDLYYSYRVERGRTGRMLAALALRP